LRQFAATTRARLQKLERQVERAQAGYRRRAAALLREASSELGRFEARGEQGWRKLDLRARRRVGALLRRLDLAVGTGRGRNPGRKATRRTVRRAQRTIRKVAAALEP
jgi:hypothetical protein